MQPTLQFKTFLAVCHVEHSCHCWLQVLCTQRSRSGIPGAMPGGMLHMCMLDSEVELCARPCTLQLQTCQDAPVPNI